MSNPEYNKANCQRRLSVLPHPRTGTLTLYEHVAETYVFLSDANFSLDQFCGMIAALGQSVIERDLERAFTFEGGYATIRLVDNTTLLFRATAENVLTLFGIQTIFETSLFKISAIERVEDRKRYFGATSGRHFRGIRCQFDTQFSERF